MDRGFNLPGITDISHDCIYKNQGYQIREIIGKITAIGDTIL